MGSKSLGILVRTLLFGMFLIIPSSVYAEAFSVTLVNFNNLQITSSAGNISFGVWQARAFATAGNNLGGLNEQTNTDTSNNQALATATVMFANATGEANATNLTSSVVSLVDIGPCVCLASSTARATLFNSFMVTAGADTVALNISGLVTSTQSLFTDQFGVFADSQFIVTVFVDSFTVFSMEFPRFGIGTNSMDFLLISQQLAGAITVQSNVEHFVTITIQADSSGFDEVPEPATAVLLLSGLGCMTGVIRKRRQVSRR
jgi:hypothetical protein